MIALCPSSDTPCKKSQPPALYWSSHAALGFGMSPFADRASHRETADSIRRLPGKFWL